MTYNDIVLKDAPQTKSFWDMFHSEMDKWVAYAPTTIDKDIPLGTKWWTILYWVPTKKREIYETLLKGRMKEVEILLYGTWGIDFLYFRKHYKFFLDRLEKMDKIKYSTGLEETKL
jgi:hypothetical protein